MRLFFNAARMVRPARANSMKSVSRGIDGRYQYGFYVDIQLSGITRT
jgi:hypothetical protein